MKMYAGIIVEKQYNTVEKVIVSFTKKRIEDKIAAFMKEATDEAYKIAIEEVSPIGYARERSKADINDYYSIYITEVKKGDII